MRSTDELPLSPTHEDLYDFLHIEPPIEIEWAEYIGHGWEYSWVHPKDCPIPPARIRVAHLPGEPGPGPFLSKVVVVE